MLKPRGDFAAEVLPGGRVIVMGGETSNGTATGKRACCCACSGSAAFARAGAGGGQCAEHVHRGFGLAVDRPAGSEEVSKP
jgi:hypothetical protein